MFEHPITIATLQKNQRERIRIALDHFQGHDLLDIRVTTQIGQTADVWSPTKKGVAISVALLPDLRIAVAEAEERARSLGLIGGEA